MNEQNNANTDHRSTNAAHIGLFLGPLLLLACLLTNPPGELSREGWTMLGITLLMAVWWATEAIPIPATALLPILLIPLFDVDSIASATTPYANPTIFLFLGGFMIGLAMQRWNLHKRIALSILRRTGSDPRMQIGGFMLACVLLGMWVSNTATAIMMLPMGLSVIALTGQKADGNERARFACALLLGIAYACSIGGITTLIGTPPNAMLAAFLNDNYGLEIGFGKWMLLSVPVACGLLIFVWWWLTFRGFNIERGETRELLQQERHELGPMSRGEKYVAIVFIAAALGWIFRPLLADLLPSITDTTIAIAATIVLFMTPVDFRNRVFLMDWEHANKAPWGVLLLFGGGLSLAAAIIESGLAEWIANGLDGMAAFPLIVTIGAVVLLIMCCTEITSNTATAAAFLPLVGALAVAQGIPPELLAIPAAITASCAFMMPVATPPMPSCLEPDRYLFRR
jgi:sodium-dependent dicarboxylate transporter 2/3/5